MWNSLQPFQFRSFKNSNSQTQHWGLVVYDPVFWSIFHECISHVRDVWFFFVFFYFQRGRLPVSLLEPIDVKMSKGKKENVCICPCRNTLHDVDWSDLIFQACVERRNKLKHRLIKHTVSKWDYRQKNYVTKNTWKCSKANLLQLMPRRVWWDTITPYNNRYKLPDKGEWCHDDQW